jgi:Ice-binding-like
MNRFENITKPLMWFMALLLTAFIAGCGGGSSATPASASTSTSADKAINTFSIAWTTTPAPGTATGTIDQTLKTIKVTVPHATLLTPMTAIFLHTGVVTVGSVTQMSGSTQNDFTLPVSYKVTAADGTWATYTVIISRNPTVTSLAITPASATTPKGATQQFVARATYLDTSIDVVTTTASWTSAASGVASVGSFDTAGTPGLAVGVTANATPVVITADFGGQTATAAMTVTNAALLSIAVSPATGATTPVGGTYPFVATGTYTDSLSTGIYPLVTATAIWTSGAGATVVNGLATGVTANPAPETITATIGSVFGTADLLVTPAPGPNLLRTANFAVLTTGSTITNSGATTVTTGDVGATGESIAGTLTVSTGTNYPLGTEQPYLDAKADIQTVLDEANNLTGLFPCSTTTTGAVDLINVHLAPGVVTCFTGAINNTGVVTLDGPGVYIIRTTAALTPSAGSSVAYGTGTGGTATDANTTVFWVVGSANITSAVGITHVIWKGTILSSAAVLLGDSATLITGRVLAKGPVTLTNNTITKP